jgi:hypothetical protein
VDQWGNWIDNKTFQYSRAFDRLPYAEKCQHATPFNAPRLPIIDYLGYTKKTSFDESAVKELNKNIGSSLSKK